MGMTRTIAAIFVSFFGLNLLAQDSFDTVYFSGREFVEHVVKGGESLKSIATLHKVETSEIILANEINRRLFYNQLLYIPIYLNNRDEQSVSIDKLVLQEEKDDDLTINIALLMPYYLLKNDVMSYKGGDTLDVSNRYYKKSEAALSFHVGVELAIDSLRRTGKKIILHTFDTSQDSLIVKKIVDSNQLNDMDIIIGPMFSNLFQIVCARYGKENSKILISPLSRDNRKVRKFPAVYQISLTHKVQAEILTDYLINNKINERIIILHDSKEETLTAYLKHKFNQKNKKVESFKITDTSIEAIQEFFLEFQNVLLLSRDKVFISKMFSSIGSIDAVSTVFSFESITSYDNLDINNLMDLDVHIVSSRSINFSDSYDLRFISLFEEEYNTNSRKYSKEGYDIIMHFCGNASLYDFKKLKNGYYENTSAPLYHYLDYELVPVHHKKL